MSDVILEDVDKGGGEKASPIDRDDKLYNKKIVAKPASQPKIGIDVDGDFYDTIIRAAQKSELDISKLEAFSQMSQNREQIYTLIDTMSEDSTIAAILETYAEDATEINQDGRIMWVTSDDESVVKYITYLMDTMNIDKNSYGWVYSLIKYGDLYLRLYRESEYNDKLFDDDDEEESASSNKSPVRVLNESKTVMDESYEQEKYSAADSIEEDVGVIDDSFAEELSTNSNQNTKKILQEDVKLKLFSQNDRYVHYIEAVPNPAEMYELTKFGKSYAYIHAPTSVGTSKNNDVLKYNNMFSYSFKKRDVKVFESTEFVHAALEDNSSRTPEEVKIFLTDSDFDKDENSLTYRVKRGKSVLYNSYKIWRELMLLEYSMLLNRVTKSSIVRIIGVEVGDMPKEQIGPHLQGVKSLFEQKVTIDQGNGMSEYTNPGPVENNIYIPTHNGIGAISPTEVGGEVNVTGLGDIDYFRDKLFGSMKVPKQFFGFCLRGDTLLPLTNGEVVTIKELSDNFNKYKDVGIYSCTRSGVVVESKIINACLTRENSGFIRIYLNNGRFIDVTEDHRMMLKDGSFKLAKSVAVGDVLMPFKFMVDGLSVSVFDNRFKSYSHSYNSVKKYIEMLTAISSCDILNPELETSEVMRIECLDVSESAYDITVDGDIHTFATCAGVFVHNCDDAGGFDGGTSLSIISSRYAKTVKRIQNTYIQSITDVLNLMLIDKGLSSYVNKFQLHMVPPTTREEIDRQDSLSSKLQLTRDVVDLTTVDVKDIESRLKILKALLSEVIPDSDILSVIQEEVDKFEQYKRDGVQVDENGDIIEPEDTTGLTGDLGGDFGGVDFGGDLGGGDFGGDLDLSPEPPSDSSSNLPSPDSLGIDFTQN